jgi:hypothetical protein
MELYWHVPQEDEPCGITEVIMTFYVPSESFLAKDATEFSLLTGG